MSEQTTDFVSLKTQAATVREVPCYACDAAVGEPCKPMPNYKRAPVTARVVSNHKHRVWLREHVERHLAAGGHPHRRNGWGDCCDQPKAAPIHVREGVNS